MRMLTILLLILSATTLRAQSTLTLEVKSLTDTSKVTLKLDGKTLNAKDVLALKGKTWNFKVLANRNHFTLRIQNNSPIKTTEIAIQGDKNFVVRNDSLGGILLTKSIGIAALTNAGETIKSFNQLTYLDSLEIAGPRQPENNKKLAAEVYQYGSIFYDAKYLADPSNDVVTKVNILRRYLDLPETVGIDSIREAVKDNPYLVKFVDSLREKLKSIPIGQQAGNPLSFITNSAVGGLNVTNFADGLAKFLVKRFKEELTITFFERLKDSIEANVELQTLFPQTQKVLLTIDKNIYQFSAYLNTIRETFVKDLTNLYVNFKKFRALDKYQSFFDRNKELATIITNAFYVVDQYSRGVHPGDVLKNYDTTILEFTDPSLQENTRNAVSLAQALSSSFTSSSPDHYWVPADSILHFLRDNLSWDLYFGILFEKHGDISFATDKGNLIRLDHLLGNAKQEGGNLFGRYKAYVETFVSHVQEINEYLGDLKFKDKKDIDYNDYYKLFNASLDLLEKGFDFVDLPNVKLDAALEAQISLQAKRWIYVSRSTADLYVDIRTKNYSSAILNLCTIIDTVFLDCPNRVKTSILRYGTFAASIAAAKNSDEVEAAIEAVALPAGSARIKRESARNISINAFVGGYAGAEYMPALKQKQNSFSAGLTAPVGIAFSWGLKCDKQPKKAGKSISIFVPLIDIGAIASFRLQNDSSEVASEVKLKNIISPGLYVYYGFGKIPLSLGIGAQAGPQLRKITAADFNVEKNYYIRYGIVLAVDIPLLNLHTRSW